MNKPMAVESEHNLKRKLIAIDINELLSMDIPPRVALLEPGLPCKSLVMAYSKHGVGKTHLALNIANAMPRDGR